MPKSLGQLMTETIANINSMEIHVCAANEYDSTTLVPTIEHPNEHTFYLVPDGSSIDLYTEWVRIGSSWEKFGAARVDLSGKADKNNTELTGSLSMNRKASTTVGVNSIAMGNNAVATNNSAVALGYNVNANGTGTFAEGYGSTNPISVNFYTSLNPNDPYKTTSITVPTGCSGSGGQHSEGYYTTASGAEGQHSEGYYTYASGGQGQHAEGYFTYATGSTGQHAEGCYTSTSGQMGQHAEGVYTHVSTTYAGHTEGEQTVVTGNRGHAEGQGSVAAQNAAHAEGYFTISSGQSAHAEGKNTIAGGDYSHAEGISTKSTGYCAHTEGNNLIGLGSYSHSEGYGGTVTYNNSTFYTGAAGYADHVEGYCSFTGDNGYSHAEGYQTAAVGGMAHSEGQNTHAAGNISHAEGVDTIAAGIASHAEGKNTLAYGDLQHAEGAFNVEDSYRDLTEWASSTAYEVGDKVKKTTVYKDGIAIIEGFECITAHTSGVNRASVYWKDLGPTKYIHIAGNGTADNARSNAYALDWDGNGHYMGDVYVGANVDSSGGNKVATEAYVNARIPAPPSADGTYTLQLTVASGEATYAWV